MSIRAKNFAREVAAGSSLTKAVYSAGYEPGSPRNASVQAARLMHQEAVRTEIERVRSLKVGKAERMINLLEREAERAGQEPALVIKAVSEWFKNLSFVKNTEEDSKRKSVKIGTLIQNMS